MSLSNPAVPLSSARASRAVVVRAIRAVDRDVGGALRLRVMVLFACVLMLN